MQSAKKKSVGLLIKKKTKAHMHADQASEHKTKIQSSKIK